MQIRAANIPPSLARVRGKSSLNPQHSEIPASPSVVRVKLRPKIHTERETLFRSIYYPRPLGAPVNTGVDPFRLKNHCTSAGAVPSKIYGPKPSLYPARTLPCTYISLYVQLSCAALARVNKLRVVSDLPRAACARE